MLSPTLFPAQAPTTRDAFLLQCLSSELRRPSHQLQSFLRLREDLFLDNVDVNLLIATLESNLEYYLTEEETSQIETIGDLQTFFLR